MLQYQKGIDSLNIKTCYTFQNGQKQYIWKDLKSQTSYYDKYFCNVCRANEMFGTSSGMYINIYNLNGTLYELQDEIKNRLTNLPLIEFPNKYFSSQDILAMQSHNNGLIFVDSLQRTVNYYPNLLDQSKSVICDYTNYQNYCLYATDKYIYMRDYNDTKIYVYKKVNNEYILSLTYPFANTSDYWYFENEFIIASYYKKRIMRISGDKVIYDISISGDALTSSVPKYFIGDYIYFLPRISYDDSYSIDRIVQTPLTTLNVITGEITTTDKKTYLTKEMCRYISLTLWSDVNIHDRLPEGSYAPYGEFAIFRFLNGDFTYAGEFFHAFYDDTIDPFYARVIDYILLPNPDYKSEIPLRIVAFNRWANSEDKPGFKYKGSNLYAWIFGKPEDLINMPEIINTNIEFPPIVSLYNLSIAKMNNNRLLNSAIISFYTGYVETSKAYFINGLDSNLSFKLITTA